jgi:hypothetical protein
MNPLKASSLLVAMLIGSSASAQFYSFGFESLDALSDGWNGPGTTRALSSTTGVTEGDYALEITQGDGKYWDFTLDVPDKMDFLTALNAAGGIIKLDVTSTFATGNTGNWGELEVVLQGGGFSNTSLPKFSIFGLEQATVELDFSAHDFSGANGSWLMMQFAFNQADGTKSYLDNLRIGVIPEPSSLSLVVALAVGALSLRRRLR